MKILNLIKTKLKNVKIIGKKLNNLREKNKEKY